MSSYVNFYLKNGKTEAITYLFGYSRNSKVYEVFHKALGNHLTNEGYCKPLTITEINNLIHSSVNLKNENIKYIESYEKSMKDLATWNNSVEDKMEYYSEWDHCIREIKEEIEELDYVNNFYAVLFHMIDYNPDKAIILAGIDAYASKEEEKEC